MTPTPEPAPTARGPLLTRSRVTRLTWVVLGLVPVLWVVELTGPTWLNMVLRALWVLVAVGTVVAGVALYAGERRRARR